MTKRSWQAVAVLVLPNENKTKSKSFLNYQEALDWGRDWLLELGPDDDRRPSVHVGLRDGIATTPAGHLQPEEYQLQWMSERRAVLQITWPPVTPEESTDQLHRTIDSWMGGPSEGARVRRLGKIVAVAQDGDEKIIGLEFEL